MPTIIAAPDADVFPLSDEDRALADEHGYAFAEFAGHTPADFAAHASTAHGTLIWRGKHSAETFDTMPGLRVVARCGAGFDNVDLAEATRRSIVVTYCPGLFDRSVAEHTLAFMLALRRRLLVSDHAVRAGSWPSAAELAPIGLLRDSTIGLVGFGRIARIVHSLVSAFGATTHVYDPFVSAADLPEGVSRADDLDDLLANSDIVSLHLPLSDSTRGLIGAQQLQRMKRTASLVNSGRGGLVDGLALAEALSAGTIAGAALDVFDPEPIPLDHPILAAPHCIITPHSSAFDEVSIASVRRQAILDAIAVLDGAEPRYPVPATFSR